MSIRLDFNKGTVKQDLTELVEKMREAGLEALDVASEEMIAVAYGLCRKDTGSLASSIRKERHGNTFKVRAGGYVVNPKTGQLVNYAALIEAKYPFMRPAFELARSRIADMIKVKVLEKVRSYG